jgi:glycosyltransferase involved in cell wall biosynthesis
MTFPVEVKPWHNAPKQTLNVSDARFGVNFIHQNAEMMSLFVSACGLDFLKTRYNIGLWVWELHAGYAEWEPSASLLHEIWAPSSFVVRALQTISPVPVIHVPYVVEAPQVDQQRRRADFNIPPSGYVFLYVFDLSSGTERKNPFALVEAFLKAFSERDNVCLVLKYTGRDHAPAAAEMLENMAAAHRNIRTLSGVMDPGAVGALFHLADCFVSPHRSEGFGLNIASAMAIGKPVICTGYSGNTDYTDESNSYGIRYKLTNIHETAGPYRQNYAWANPCVYHLAELLRQVHSNREEAARKAEAGRGRILRDYSIDAVARSISARLQEAAPEIPHTMPSPPR